MAGLLHHALRLAHRGAGGYVRENTLEAFRWAAEHRHKVDGVELDVFVTKDGQVVVNHDPELINIGPEPLAIADLTAQELWETARVPTLKEVLRICFDGGLKMVVVELKGDNTPHPVASVFEDLIPEFGRERVFSSLRVSGFGLDIVDTFGSIEAFREIPRAYTSSVFYDELIERAVRHGITDLHLHQKICDVELVEKIHANKLKLMVYSSGTIQESGMTFFFPFHFVSSYSSTDNFL